MFQAKEVRVMAGILSLSLMLSGIVTSAVSGGGPIQSINEAVVNSWVYLPLMTSVVPFTISRVSLASNGTEGNDDSMDSSISADGRYVAFSSIANNLVSGDTNGVRDIFVHDRQTGQTSRVSVTTSSTQANDRSYSPVISADGRYVAFTSNATNLVNGDTNNWEDIFVHDRQTGQTRRVSVASNGTQGDSFSLVPSISGDGRYIAFVSDSSNLINGDTNGHIDVFVHDQQTGQNSLISKASNGTQSNLYSSTASISADGRYVAFDSMATNLVVGDTNGQEDIFVHDQQTGQTSRVSVASDGTQSSGGWGSEYPVISANGRYVVFESSSSNLVNGDMNGVIDCFIHDRQTGQTQRISVASDGTEGNHYSTSPTISAEGRYVGFNSWASNLVNGDTFQTLDVFIHDQQTGETRIISINANGVQGNGQSGGVSMTANARFVAFSSLADNLISGDTNNEGDVFVQDWGE